jgi:hypothetical protein
MGVPAFLLRKLYRKGSLRETGDGRFAFDLRNTLSTATLVSPPRFVVNGVAHAPQDIMARDRDGHAIDAADISPKRPYAFTKGATIGLTFRGHLLRGGNRIHVSVVTTEFGRLDFLVEDKEAEFCDIPSSAEE